MVIPSSSDAKALARPSPRVLCKCILLRFSSPTSFFRSLMSLLIWFGFAYPVVSDKPISSQPSPNILTPSFNTKSSETLPSKVHPNAVERLPSNSGLCNFSSCSIYSEIFLISSRTSSWLFLRLAWLCVSLTDRGKQILSAPASIAFFAPMKFGTSATTVRFGISFAY